MMGESAPLSKDELEKRLTKAKKLAGKYKNPRQFALAHPQLWNTIRSFDKLDDVFPERRKYKPDGYWDAITIADESRKYDGRTEFLRGNQIAYLKALELGIMDDLFPIKKKTREPYYTLDKSIELAKDFEGDRMKFFDEYPSAYKVLNSNDLLTKYFGDKIEDAKASDDVLLDKGKEYESIIDLNKNNNPLYIALKRRSLLNKLYPEPLKVQKLLDRAKNYENKYDLKIKNRNLYNALIRAGLWEKLFPKTPIEKLSLSDLAKDIDNTPKED